VAGLDAAGIERVMAATGGWQLVVAAAVAVAGSGGHNEPKMSGIGALLAELWLFTIFLSGSGNWQLAVAGWQCV
jgi:hypothetical protein